MVKKKITYTAIRIRRPLGLALAAWCLTLGVGTSTAQTVAIDGAIDVTQPHDSSLVLDSSVRFLRGHRLTLRVEGQIDANHKYWNQRKCKWFGLKCWYEKRSRANWVELDRLPLEVCVVPETAIQCNPSIAVSRPDWGDLGSEVLTTQGSLTQRFRALGRVRDPQGDGGRNSCAHVSMPGYCSAGQYRPRLEVDLSGRLALLREFLQQRRPTNDVIDDQLIDPLTRRSKPARKEAAEILFEYIQARHPPIYATRLQIAPRKSANGTSQADFGRDRAKKRGRTVSVAPRQ